MELLISMALSGLLASGTISVYLSSQRQFLFADQLARVQENGRYATRLVRRELALSGFYAGLPPTLRPDPVAIGGDCNVAGWALDGRVPLDFVDNHAGAPEPATVTAIDLTCVDGRSIVVGSDLLVVKRTAAQASVIGGLPAQGLVPSSVERWHLKTVAGENPVWEQHRPVDLLDSSPHPPDNAYWEARAAVFYLRAYSSSPEDGIPTLCMDVLAGDGMTLRCMVEGVEDLQVEFGIDTNRDGAVEQYSSRPTALQMALARTARIYFLVRSLQPLPGHRDGAAYHLGEKVVAPRNDRYLRKVFSATVRLRNPAQLVARASAP